jgi:hypothetical protein
LIEVELDQPAVVLQVPMPVPGQGDVEPAEIDFILVSPRDMPAEEAIACVAVEPGPEGAATGYEAVAGLEVITLNQVAHRGSSIYGCQAVRAG